MKREESTLIEEKKEKIHFKSFVDKIKLLWNKKTSLHLNQKQKINFFDSLYSLINSGIPITNSLSIMLFQTKDKNIKFLLETMSKEINRWKKLAEILWWFDKIFSNFDIYMIKMWEITGKLANSFEIIRDREEKNAELKSKVIWALIYPSIIVTLSIAMIAGFMLFVIPKVQKMYIDSRANLPDLTQNVINTSQFLQDNYIKIWFWLFFIFWCLITFKNHSSTKIYADEIVLKIPIFWWLIRKKILAIFASTLWTLLQNGIMINEALEISKKSLDNAYYEKRLNEISLELNEWIALSELMWIRKLKEWKDDAYFPIELASVIKIWEQTWKMPILLIKIAVKFNKEVDVIVKWLSNVIEPVVIIFVWAVVWTMIMAILLPFFNMANVM